ncbi:unnamed protein product, partial [Ectocarpus sp. 4 AP-2014]
MPPGRHGDGLGDAAGGAASGVVDVSRLQHFDDAFLNKNRPPHPPQRREARAAAAAAVTSVHGGDNNSFGRQHQHEPPSSRLSWAKVHWAPRKRSSRLITTAAGGISQQQTTQLSSWAKVHWTPRRLPSRQQQQQQQRLSPTSTSPPGRTSRLTTAATFDSGDAAGVAQRPRLNSWAKVHWQPQRHTSWSGREQRPPVVATATHRVARTARLTTWAKCQWSPDQPSRSAVASPGSSRRHASSSS